MLAWVDEQVQPPKSAGSHLQVRPAQAVPAGGRRSGRWISAAAGTVAGQVAHGPPGQSVPDTRIGDDEDVDTAAGDPALLPSPIRRIDPA